MKLNKLIEMLEFFYPTNLAEDWDNVGLLLGDARKNINRVMTTLEITDDVVDEAIERGADVIVSHHPLIFKPIKALNYKEPQVRLISKLIKHDIAVYSMHTNVDISSNGMNDWLAQVLEMKNLSILRPLKTKKYKKVLIDVEAKDIEKVLEILKLSGCGQKGNVIEQHAITRKQKTICGLDEIEVENEMLELSTFILEENLGSFHRLMHNDFHYEIYEIDNINQTFGLGRIGTIKPVSLEQFADRIKKLFSLDHVRLVGDREQIICKVAIVGGSGSDLLLDAKLKNCDVIITGDVGFHDAQAALAMNMNMIDPGHNVEIIFNDVIADFINLFDDVIAFASEVDTNPFEVI